MAVRAEEKIGADAPPRLARSQGFGRQRPSRAFLSAATLVTVLGHGSIALANDGYYLGPRHGKKGTAREKVHRSTKGRGQPNHYYRGVP
jgi:hypothetical protein